LSPEPTVWFLLSVTRGYDGQFRLSTVGLSLGATATTRQRFAYDSISWLDYGKEMGQG